MKAGKYSYRELFVNRYVESLVIPEIQRDYVWGKTQVEGLLGSLLDEFNRFAQLTVPVIEEGGSTAEVAHLQQDFAEFFKKRNGAANIGFIYAYSDSQYGGHYFLIDGQQRITSLYLTLMVLAYRSEQVDIFRRDFCRGNEPKLSYRVRESAQQFMSELLCYVLENDVKGITEQSWFFQSYRHDLTVRNVLENLAIIDKWLEAQPGLDYKAWYDYLADFTECWYFDTNISAQGESLYIYLNARGEQVQESENVKANLLAKERTIKNKNDWGRQWEDWQDLFWRHKGTGVSDSNPNADKGFNEFLACITGLSIYQQDSAGQHLEEGVKSGLCSVSLQCQVLELDTISSYIHALRVLDSLKEKLHSFYPSSTWYDKCYALLWALFNKQQTPWLARYNKEDNATERREVLFAWGLLLVCKEVSAQDLNDEREVVALIRAIRQFYLRYHNHVRAVARLKEDIASIRESGFISHTKNSEEYLKERWVKALSEREDGYQLEAMIWELEDHKHNLDGRGTRGNPDVSNITHLVKLTPELQVDDLELVKEAFVKCFPEGGNDKQDTNKLKSLLLYYGDYWRATSPWYYSNLKFDDWPHIIRQGKNTDIDGPFKALLNDLINNPEMSLSNLLEAKRASELSSLEEGLRQRLQWYNQQLGERMWQYGGHIAVYHCSQERDVKFDDSPVLYNTKGSFRGNGYSSLAEMLNEKNKAVIE